jgi:beta-lactamase class A
MKFFFLFCIALAFTTIGCNHSDDLRKLHEDILDSLKKQKGNFAVAFKDLSSGDTLYINAHESFHAASTMKTPLMIEIYRQAGQGKFSLNDSLVIKNEFRSIVDSSSYILDPNDDSELDLYEHQGEKIPISGLIYLMITKSSNLATNLLIGLVGAGQVTQTMASYGAGELKILRGVEDNKAFQKGLNNMVTAYGLLTIYEKMAKDMLVDDSSSESMIRILKDQQFNEIIPAELPPTVKVAHKTGWFKSVNHDSGIIFLPDGRKYVLVLLSKNVENDKDAVKAMAEISGIFYRYVESKGPPAKT